MGYSFRLTARVILYAPSHRQDSTYHGLCFASRGALVGTRNSSIGTPHEGSIRRPIAPRSNALTTELHLAPSCQETVPERDVSKTLLHRGMFKTLIEREMFYLTTHSTHLIYGYMASDIWLRTILIVRKETRCRHIGYSFRLNSKGSFICTIPQTG